MLDTIIVVLLCIAIPLNIVNVVLSIINYTHNKAQLK